MDVKITLHTITIKDDVTGKEYSIQTLRSAEEIAGYIEESEKDEIVDRLEDAVCEAYHK